LIIEEEDGSPSTVPWKLKVPNNSLTFNADGTVSLAFFTGGTVTSSGTPTNHQWPGWTTATDLKGFTVTASKPVCSDASGDPVACAGTEGVWQAAILKGYLWIPAGSMTPITCAGLATVSQNPNMTDYLAFDGATDEYAGFTLSLEDWDLSTIKAKFVWYASAAMTNGHTVIWGLNCYAVSDGDSSDIAFSSGEVTVSDAYVTADETSPIQKTTAATAAITVQGTPAAGDVVYCRVMRNADTDTSTIDAWLVGVKIEYGKTVPTAW
jgi:hypothetical protein